MGLKADVSFKGMANEIEEAKKRYKNNGKGGGFISPQTEKNYTQMITYYKKKLFGNMALKNLDKVCETSAGEINKLPAPVLDLIKRDNYWFGELMKRCDSVNINEYSLVGLYVKTYEFLKKQEATFKKAYQSVKSKSNNQNVSIAEIFVMMHKIIIFFLMRCLAIENQSLWYLVNNGGTIFGYLEKAIENIQKGSNAFISIVGFAVIDIIAFFDSLSNPLSALTKALKEEDDLAKKLAKSKESADPLMERINLFNEFSKESFLEDKSLKSHTRGEEFVPLIILAVIGSIIGLVIIIKRVVYYIASIHVDYLKQITDEAEMLRVNVSELKEKAEKETNQKIKNKLLDVIAKQEKWILKFEKEIENARLSDGLAFNESEAENNNDNNKSDDDEDDYPVVI
jgi:methyl-accepting chemotaxis protein